MEIRRDHNNRGTKPSNSEALNAASGINNEKEAFMGRLGTLSFYTQIEIWRIPRGKADESVV